MGSPVTSVQCSSCKVWITDWQKTCIVGQSGTFILSCPACKNKLRITTDNVRMVTPPEEAVGQGWFHEG